MLCGLGLYLLGGGNVGHVCEVHAYRVVGEFPAHLAHGLEEGQTLDVADDTADFGDDEVEVARDAELFHAVLDFVGDVGNDLYGLTQVDALALLLDDSLVDAARGDIAGAGGLDVGEALVVAQVEVRLVAVHRHIALAVLVRVKRTRVDIDVRVELLDCHAITAGLEQIGQR